MSDASSDRIRQLDAIQDAFNRHDVDAILDAFAEDCVWVMARGPSAPEGRRCTGKDEIGAVLRARFEQIPDMRWVDMSHFVAGDRAASEWTVKGTSVDGKQLDLLGCDLWEFRGDKVVRKDTYWKTVEPPEA
jgi:taurine dehydrogenase small subunit